MFSNKCLVICGPTGSGKSALAMHFAERHGSEIVGCDSVQIFKGFNIGSAKPSKEDQTRVLHHMIDIREPHQEYDAGTYAKEARAVIKDILDRQKIPLIVGGSGLYLRALLSIDWHDNLPKSREIRAELEEADLADLYQRLQAASPDRAKEIHPHDRVRIVRALELYLLLGKPLLDLSRVDDVKNGFLSQPIVVILDPPRKSLHETLARRTSLMLEQGLVDEVKTLVGMGCDLRIKPMQSIGYKETLAMLNGEIKESELEGKILASTRQYAKRQTTWFRKVRADLRLQLRAEETKLMLIEVEKALDQDLESNKSTIFSPACPSP